MKPDRRKPEGGKSRRSARSRRSRPRRSRLLLPVVAVLAVGGVAALVLAGGGSSSPPDAARHAALHTSTATSKADIETLASWNGSITLDRAQEAVREEALGGLPAPCCAQFSAATCCCECNLARATWGLAKHLIVDEGLDAGAVRDRVADWHRSINPAGFAGNACFTGGCNRAFAEDGCGGMEEGTLIF